jgi:hypothetical protein
MIPKRPYRRDCLAPRCRLITSWRCRGCQGLGCSPIKVVRELGLERCETVRTLSAVVVITESNQVLVREDRTRNNNGVPIIVPKVSLGSYLFKI